MQEVYAHWFVARKKYKPECGASLKTFMERVARRRLLNIVKEKERAKRKAFYISLSLDELLEHEDGGFIKEFVATENEAVNTLMKKELSVAVTKAIDKLSFRQQELCRLLKEDPNLNQAAKRMNVARSTLQDEVRRIREIFRKDGLEEYLDKRCDNDQSI